MKNNSTITEITEEMNVVETTTFCKHLTQYTIHTHVHNAAHNKWQHFHGNIRVAFDLLLLSYIFKRIHTHTHTLYATNIMRLYSTVSIIFCKASSEAFQLSTNT